MATLAEILRSEFPQLDAELFQYVTDVLDSGQADFESAHDLFEAVGALLQDVSGDTKDDEDIRNICQRMYRTMRLENNHVPKQNQVLLQAPIQLNQITDQYDVDPQILNVLLMKKGQSSVR
ncbi:ATP-binding cassette sub-family F member 3 [Pelobates cultripes]|uniref:ATP-binding cassette sub-family F member 3 n=1 Tax=Pelobates cultripes TaxID=61616 RepID=A0AAD1VU06_PELCU|nr:ATP-binding cassette sub-family F member 3 [Pelobates cultripes]